MWLAPAGCYGVISRVVPLEPNGPIARPTLLASSRNRQSEGAPKGDVGDALRPCATRANGGTVVRSVDVLGRR